MKRKLLAAAAPFAALLVAGCAPSTSMTALIHMIEPQERYFRAEVIEPFNRRRRADIDVAHYAAIDSLGETLRQRRGEAGLVKTPFDKAWSLVDQGLIMPLNDILTPDEMREFDDIYLLTSLGAKDGKIYYTPRKFETRIMVYRKSKVAEAMAVWRKRRDEISESLAPFNGYGLPATYVLEEEPGEWDYFDIYTLGWIWAHTPVDGEAAPRIAHRGKRYSGTALRIIDRVYQCGGDSAAVLSMRSPAVTDAYHWEAAYAAGGIYTPRMWEEAWSGSGVWSGFAQGAVYLSFMTQLDCFFIHGTGRDGLEGYLDDPDDMGVAPMPAGCSLELDAHGEPLRRGSRAITTGGWWWGIPAGTPDPRASYELARHITSAENQIAGCSRFGMIPVRKDILDDMSMLFGGGWISEVYAVSFKQLMHNKYTVLPSHPRFDAVRNAYLDAWFDIVAEKNWSDGGEAPSREYIARLLTEQYGAAVQRLIARGR
jgi:ABC-type glycerol-3-phosphate transport system substrate-binding protein